jgi:hypothetical protein
MTAATLRDPHNVRLMVTRVLPFCSGLRVLASTWGPPLEWLGFLSGWAGLDVAQHLAKRATQHPPPGEE